TSSRPRSMPAGSGVSHSSNSRRRPNMISNQGLSSWPKKRHFAKLFVLSSSSCGTTSFAFFFFQAEDGIRDLYVTGVSDVCSSDLAERIRSSLLALLYDREKRRADALSVLQSLSKKYPENFIFRMEIGRNFSHLKRFKESFQVRSEERRVGKECRSVWWA